jgi:hypothetical protein
LLRCISGIPLLLMAWTFAILFAFVVGVTTPNFGALVRFKIPLVPFFTGTLFIIQFLVKLKKDRERRGLSFSLVDLRMGSAHMVFDPRAATKNRRGGSQAGGRGSERPGASINEPPDPRAHGR